MADSQGPVEPGAAQAVGDTTPEHDVEEAAAAAETPVGDRRRPALLAGLDGEPTPLEEIAARIADHFPSVTTDIVHGELTVHASADVLRDLLAFCRDDEQLRTRTLADLSGVHWPAGEHVIDRQPSTTGWPQYRVSREDGRIEVLYVLRSLHRNHWFRVSVGVPDTDPRVPTVTDLFPTANFHEREVYDFFGVDFEGHPGLTRVLMPEDWVGHPHRKDYPLGGVNIDYENDKFIPPPQRRDLREIVGGDS